MNTAGLVIYRAGCIAFPAKNMGRARVVLMFIHRLIHTVFHKVVPLSSHRLDVKE